MATLVLKAQFTAQTITRSNLQRCRKEACGKAPGKSRHLLHKQQVGCIPARGYVRAFTAKKG